MWSGFVGIKFVVAVLALAAVSWGISLKLIGQEHLDRDYQDRAARDYLQRAIPKIVSEWNFMALKERTAGELHVSDYWPQMPGKFKTYKESLGPAMSYGKLEGTVQLDSSLGREVVMGQYTQRVGFKQATGDVHVALVKRYGSWKITRFSVRSAAVPAGLDDDQ